MTLNKISFKTYSRSYAYLLLFSLFSLRPCLCLWLCHSHVMKFAGWCVIMKMSLKLKLLRIILTRECEQNKTRMSLKCLILLLHILNC